MASKVPNRQDWKFGADLTFGGNILLDKDALISQYQTYMLDRTHRMFTYDGLDDDSVKDTFSVRRCETVTQMNSYCFLVKVDSPAKPYKKGIYALNGFLGSVVDPFGIPTEATINNVALNFNKILKIGKDCVLYPNDTSFTGLQPVFSLYASLLADVDISLRYALINSRIPNMFNGTESQVAEDVQKIYEDIDAGKKLFGCVITNPFFDGFKNAINTNSKEGLIKELLEAKQYLMSNWFIFLGLNSNYNMKREAINSTESGMNEDALIPLVDDMLHVRNDALEKANKLWGTHLSVRLDSAWAEVHEDYKEESQEGDKSPLEDKKEKEESENAVD